VKVNPKELAAGSIFVAMGGWFLASTLSSLAIGTARTMGPGYVPMLLSGVLILAGFGIAVRGVVVEATDFGAIPWRGITFVIASPILFGLTVSGLGLFPAVVLTSLIAGFGSRRAKPLSALALSVGLAVFCVGLFGYGLGLPMPIFGPWF
jgi:hypothetical protein